MAHDWLATGQTSSPSVPIVACRRPLSAGELALSTNSIPEAECLTDHTPETDADRIDIQLRKLENVPTQLTEVIALLNQIKLKILDQPAQLVHSNLSGRLDVDGSKLEDIDAGRSAASTFLGRPPRRMSAAVLSSSPLIGAKVGGMTSPSNSAGMEKFVVSQDPVSANLRLVP